MAETDLRIIITYVECFNHDRWTKQILRFLVRPDSGGSAAPPSIKVGKEGRVTMVEVMMVVVAGGGSVFGWESNEDGAGDDDDWEDSPRTGGGFRARAKRFWHKIKAAFGF